MGNFSGLQSLKDAFEITDEQLIGVHPLLAWYEYESYEGDAYVLFSKDGELYEVSGSHCSCFGLERQWTPEKTTLESLRHRMTEGQLGKGYGGDKTFQPQLDRIVTLLEGDRYETAGTP